MSEKKSSSGHAGANESATELTMEPEAQKLLGQQQQQQQQQQQPSGDNNLESNGKVRISSGSSGGSSLKRACPLSSVILLVLLCCLAAGLGVLAFLYAQMALSVTGRPRDGDRLDASSLTAASSGASAASAAALLGDSPDSVGDKWRCLGIGPGARFLETRSSPCSNFHEFACGNFKRSVPLRWRSGRLESVRSSFSLLQDRIEESLLESLLLPSAPATPLRNFSRACVSAGGDFSPASMRQLFAQPAARFTPIAYFGSRTVRWGSEFSFERTLAQFLVHDIPLLVDLRVEEVPESAAAGQRVLGWTLQPAELLLDAGDSGRMREFVQAVHRQLGVGVPSSIARAIVDFAQRVQRIVGEAGDAGSWKLEVASFAEVSGLFPSPAAWPKFRNELLQRPGDLDNAGHTAMLLRASGTVRRLLALAAGTDPEVLVGYGLLHTLLRLRPYSAWVSRLVSSGQHPVRLRQLPLTSGSSAPVASLSASSRCLASGFDIFPELLGELLPAGDVGQTQRLAQQLRKELLDMGASQLSIPDLQQHQQLQRERLRGLYSGLVLPSVPASYLDNILDALRHRRLAVHSMALAASRLPLRLPWQPAESAMGGDWRRQSQKVDDAALRFPPRANWPLLDSRLAELRLGRLGVAMATEMLAGTARGQLLVAGVNVSDACGVSGPEVGDVGRLLATRAALRLLQPDSAKSAIGDTARRSRQLLLIASEQLACEKVAEASGASTRRREEPLTSLPEFREAFGCDCA